MAVFLALAVLILASIISLRLLGENAAYGIIVIFLIPFFAFFFFNDSFFLVFAYIALLPLIQHQSVHGMILGDFVISPHMVVQFFILLAITNSFLLTYDPRRKWTLNKLDKTILLFALCTSFSLIFAYTLPVNHTKRWLLFYTGIFETVSFYFVVVYMASRDENVIEKILVALMLTSFSSAIIGVQEINTIGYNLVNLIVARMRYGFGYHNGNLFGIHSALVFPIVMYMVVSPKFRRLRLVSILSFVTLTLLSLLCFNRGTFIVMGLEVFLLYFMRENRRVIHWSLVSLIGIAVYFNRLLIVYLYRFFGAADSTSASFLDASALYRYEAWKVGLKLLVLYPLGLGGGGFQYGWELYGSIPSLYLGTPHQLFLSIGVDYGVLTMVVFMAMVVLAYVYSGRLSKRLADNSHAEMFKYIKVSIVGFVVYGMLTDGELSHLSGFIFPNNGYTLVLFALFAFISFFYSKYHVRSSESQGTPLPRIEPK